MDRGITSAALDACARVLAPAGFVRWTAAGPADHRADHAWLREHHLEHRGWVVAIGNGALVARARTPDALMRELQEHRDSGRLMASVLVVTIDAQGRVC